MYLRQCLQLRLLYRQALVIDAGGNRIGLPPAAAKALVHTVCSPATEAHDFADRSGFSGRTWLPPGSTHSIGLRCGVSVAILRARYARGEIS